jgi:hypothetical protein
MRDMKQALLISTLLCVFLAGCAAAPPARNLERGGNTSADSSSSEFTFLPGTDSDQFAIPLPAQPQPLPEEALSASGTILRDHTEREAVIALKNRDMSHLADLASEEGIRFSISGNIREEDIVLKPEQIRSAFADNHIRHWGTLDGSGEPYEKTFTDFYAFLYGTVDYAGYPVVWNKTMSPFRPTLDDVREVYGQSAQVAEHTYPGEIGMDFETLKIVLTRNAKGAWKVAGLIRVYWSP